MRGDHSDLRRRRGVRRIVGMEIVSGLGDGVFWVGLVAVLLDQGVGARGFALAVLVRLGPRALISAPAGALADQVDRRRLLVGLDVARAGVMVVIALLAAAGTDAWALLAAVLVAYTLATPYRPALTAALPLVAGEAGLSAANALVGTVRQVMTFVGPVVGAAVVHWTSPSAAFAVNAASFLVAAWFVNGVRELGGRRDSMERGRVRWGGAGGWGEVRATTGLLVMLWLVFAVYAARGAELVLYALAAEDLFGLGAGGVGLLTGAVGLGALVALPFASRVAEAERPGAVLVGAIVANVVPFVLLVWVRSPAAACLCLVVVGAGVVVFEVMSIVLLQRLAPERVLGRVFGLVGTSSNAGKLIGALLAPVVVAVVGLRGTFALVGIALGVSAVFATPGLVALTTATRARREALQPVVDVLATLGVFEGASRLAVQRVASAVVPVEVAAGNVVIRQGDPADDLFVVRQGSMSVTLDGREINVLGVDDWFGEIGLLQRRPRTATVSATTQALVWRIPGAAFLGALEDMAAEPAALIDVMTDRIARTSAAAR